MTLRMLATFAFAALPLLACGRSSLDDLNDDPSDDPSNTGDESSAQAGSGDSAQKSNTADTSATAIGKSSQKLSGYFYPPPVVINFDSDAAGAALADGTVVDTSYSALGVTFTCIVCSSGHAYARAPGRTGNGVSLFQAPYVPVYDARYGAVRADFASPRSFVSIDSLGVLPPEWLGTPAARPWIEAYDANNTMIARTYYPAYGDPAWGTWQTLTVTAPAGSAIKYVRFSSQYFQGVPPVYGSFDNLTFNADPIRFNCPTCLRSRICP